MTEPLANPVPGRPYPLGATPWPNGTNFAVASDVADGMILCLFDGDGQEQRIAMQDYDAGVWHAFVPGIAAGQAYGFRATGPWDLSRGIRCVESKLLLDPYARAITGAVQFGPAVLGHAEDDPDQPSPLDSAGSVPLSLVVDPAFDWEGDVRPGRSYADSIFYELHVKGLTQLHPSVPDPERGPMPASRTTR